MGFLSYGYKALKGVGQAINKTKTNVPKTEVQKKLRDLKIATQKSKGSLAKLKQTAFEIKNNKPITFKKSTKKSESNKEAYKRIQNENSKVIKSMLDKATENKKDGGRMGLKGGGNDMGSTTNKSINSLKNALANRKNRKKSKIPSKQEEQKDMALQRVKDRPYNPEDDFDTYKKRTQAMGGDVSFKTGGRIGRKMGGGSDMGNTNVKKKHKGFSKLPETVQIKINKKLAKKV